MGRALYHRDRKVSRSVLSVNGRIDIQRTRWQQGKGIARTAGPKSVVPVDALLDKAQATVSLGVCELCCRLGIAGGSMARNVENLFHAADLRMGEELFRQIIEGEGQAVLTAAQEEQLPVDWCAKDCQTLRPDGSVASRVYVSADGVMVPVTTQAEKDRRRETVLRRRREKPRRRGVKRRRLLAVKEGSDQRYKQNYLTVMYDQQKHKRRLVSVTRGDHKAMGKLLARDAGVLRLPAAQEKIGLVDGAVCLQQHLDGLTLTATGLDFFHLSEHVHEEGRECGDPVGSANAKRVKKRPKAAVIASAGATGQVGPVDEACSWASDVLHTVKHQGYAPFWDKLVERRNRLRGHRRKKADKLLHYVAQRQDMINYDQFIKKGWDIGTGPMEAMCKATTRRIKGPGMRWDSHNAEALMAMEALYQSNLWDAWWAKKHRHLAA